MNGRPSAYMKAHRGFRQGDPISPLLFVLIMEQLHRWLNKLKDKPNFKYHPKCVKLHITNICFADDLISFARGDENSVQIMMQELHNFSDATGLKANRANYKVYCGGMHTSEIHKILQITGCSAGTLPFKYLGVPLSSRKLNIHQCHPLVDRILEKTLDLETFELCGQISTYSKCSVFYHFLLDACILDTEESD
ncbi:uncharacterized protein LOC131650545 [Vicia villosa]|uniref:uncharacterized protein LOC131650545 n=1 Tax=Vicia villosa TaxID=3911 RepID=UPI00273AE6AC|nr:uncharacterized protein LOC131650545 [Vicia villosa]